MFLGKTLNSHGASLHPGVSMGTGESTAGGGGRDPNLNSVSQHTGESIDS